MESLRGVLARRLACNADAGKECSKKQRSAKKCILGECKRILQETPDCSSTAGRNVALTRTWDYCRCCKHYLQISKVNSIFPLALRRAAVRSLMGRDQISAGL